MEQRLSGPTIWTLVAASAVCAGMVVLRIVYTDRLTYYWLIVPNLLLAWIPLVASVLVCRTLRDGRRPGAATAIWGAVWLAFYPNASYIVTDLKHLGPLSAGETLYYDLSVNMLAAMLGWFLGALSLYGLHSEIRQRTGALAGTAFAVVVIVLGAVGVYLGRVLRWNSWDLVVRPHAIATDLLSMVQNREALVFVVAFALCTGAAYAVLYRLLGPRKVLQP